LIEKFSSNLDLKNFIAITIAIENLIRINHDPIFIFQTGSFFPEKSLIDLSDLTLLGALPPPRGHPPIVMTLY
jgi:hypothetical protein